MIPKVTACRAANTKTGVYMAENKNDSIIFEAEDGTEVEFAVLEQTTLGRQGG